MSNSDYLGGSNKAVMLARTLGQESAQPLIDRLNEHDVSALFSSLRAHRHFDHANADAVHRQFLNRFTAGEGFFDDPSPLQTILLKNLPEGRTFGGMNDADTESKDGFWRRLDSLNEEILAGYLRNEFPQTIGLILSMMRPSQAAKVICQFPRPLALEAVMRILTMEAASPEILRHLEMVLASEFMTSLSSKETHESYSIVADILNNSDSAVAASLLADMKARNAGIAEKVQARMFTFADLPRLSPASIRTVLGAVPKEVLALALKGVADDVKQFFFDQMSSRQAMMLAESIQTLGPVKVRQVEEAQGSILATAKELAERRLIDLEISKGENVIE